MALSIFIDLRSILTQTGCKQLLNYSKEKHNGLFELITCKNFESACGRQIQCTQLTPFLNMVTACCKYIVDSNIFNLK